MIRRLLLTLALVGCQAAPQTTPQASGRGTTTDGSATAPAAAAPLDLMGGAAGGCDGSVVSVGGQRFLRLDDGTLLTRAPLAVRADGAARAYHPESFEAGAILHRCNAGEVHLPDGTRYMGGASEASCARFERDVARIEAAGWDDGAVGAVRWFGIAAEGSARVAGQRVPGVHPVIGADGYYVSRTPLRDENRTTGDPDAYPEATRVPYAFTRRDQAALGTHGVALRTRGCPYGRICKPVPFVVAGRSPQVGVGSIALARTASGLETADELNRRNRYRGQTDGPDLLYVFFGGEGVPFEQGRAMADARAAFETWGGQERLNQCRRAFIPEAG